MNAIEQLEEGKKKISLMYQNLTKMQQKAFNDEYHKLINELDKSINEIKKALENAN